MNCHKHKSELDGENVEFEIRLEHRYSIADFLKKFNMIDTKTVILSVTKYVVTCVS